MERCQLCGGAFMFRQTWQPLCPDCRSSVQVKTTVEAKILDLAEYDKTRSSRRQQRAVAR